MKNNPMEIHTTREIADKYKHCVCRIYTYLNNIPVSQGSGVFIKSKKIIVTNYHIFIGSNNYKVEMAGDIISNCKIISINSHNDLTLIYFNSKLKEVEEVVINTETNIGDQVYTFGYPLNYGLTMSEGIISSTSAALKINMSEYFFTKEIIQPKVIQITATISQGNSGGALVNENGELIGITTYSDNVGKGINFAIPGGEVINEIKGLDLLDLKVDRAKKYKVLNYYYMGLCAADNGNFMNAYKLTLKAYPILKHKKELLYNLTMFAYYNDDYNNALIHCNRLIKVEKLSLRALSAKIAILLKLENYNNLFNTIKKGLKLFPNNSMPYVYKAMAYYNLNKFNQALNSINKAYYEFPNVTDNIQLKAEICVRLNKLDSALSLYESLIFNKSNIENEENFLDITAEICLNLGYYRKSLNYYNDLIKISGENYKHFFNRARTFALMEDYESAIEDLKICIKINPKFALSYFNIAYSYIEIGDFKEAIKYYSKFILLEPNEIDGFINRGNAYYRFGNYISAIEDFKLVFKKTPQSIDMTNNIVSCYYALNDVVNAKKYLDKIKNPIKNGESLFRSRAEYYFRTGNNKKAVLELKKGKTFDCKDYQMCLQLAKVYFDMNLLNDALKEVNTALILSPKNIVVYISKAEVLLKLRKYNSAFKLVNEALNLDPDFSYSYYVRGEIFAALKKYKLAIMDYEHSINLFDKYPDCYLRLGSAYLKTKMINSAIYNFEQACNLDKSYEKKVIDILRDSGLNKLYFRNKRII